MSAPVPTYRLKFTAGPEHIDFMGHVNNAIWLTWVQEIAGAHWEAVAPREHVEGYLLSLIHI